MNSLKCFSNRISFFSLLFMLPFLSIAQTKSRIIIKEGDTLRLPSTGKKIVDVTMTILVPMDKDSSDKKKNYADQDSLKMGKVFVEFDKSGTTANLSKISLPITNEFKLDSLKKQNKFLYNLRVPRDSLDDKMVSLKLSAKTAQGDPINQANKRFMIYIKPSVPDSLSTNGDFEWWFHAGTNFDLFDGVKSEEFFFRANIFFKITDKLYAQTAFYKNRYFLDGQNNEDKLNFNTIKRPVGFGDTLTTLTSGSYKRTTKQTADPLAWQLDLLYKIKEEKNSSFFLSGGWDISTTTVRVENDYKYLDTTYTIRTSRPDTVKNANKFGTTNFPGSLKYKKPAYNFNVGFMWVYNEEKTINVKTQLTGGISSYTDLSYVEENKSNVRYNFEPKTKPYVQIRIMGTYKPLGISIGMESFLRSGEYPAFNFTLSKAFDLRKLVTNFTPVSALKIQ